LRIPRPVSAGAATSIAYAARHPHRVSKLVLYGGYAQGRNRRSSLAVFLDDLQWLDAATLDKAVEMKVNFYAAHLKGWA
jgi:pimeloyl-ACP methyl ester carboxylesterase